MRSKFGRTLIYTPTSESFRSFSPPKPSVSVNITSDTSRNVDWSTSPDLEVLFLKLLEDEMSIGESAAQDFDLILVDEFQDTNPLQLAIFQRLRRIAPRSRWVGDPKQAIYGFRDTDPELINEVWTNATDATRTDLPNNHRSQKRTRAACWSPVLAHFRGHGRAKTSKGPDPARY